MTSTQEAILFLKTTPFIVSAIPGFFVCTNKDDPTNVVVFGSCTLPDIFASAAYGSWSGIPVNWSMCDFFSSFGVPNSPIPTPSQLFSLLQGIRIPGPCG